MMYDKYDLKTTWLHSSSFESIMETPRDEAAAEPGPLPGPGSSAGMT